MHQITSARHQLACKSTKAHFGNEYNLYNWFAAYLSSGTREQKPPLEEVYTFKLQAGRIVVVSSA